MLPLVDLVIFNNISILPLLNREYNSSSENLLIKFTLSICLICRQTGFAVSLLFNNPTSIFNPPSLMNPNTTINIRGKKIVKNIDEGFLNIAVKLALVTAFIAFNWLYLLFISKLLPCQIQKHIF